ncbi:hypothetical protein [uncultured Legionella sp.]|uniref:hypothetical protein n=1 Tax=uncultured Legionella sp. TaxID=210934 RepID=UPI00261BC0D0|nr:hypothetical protein [uncultured Legionella sp.]
MWYKMLLKNFFIAKVKTEEQDAAIKFINAFFPLYEKTAREYNNTLPPLIIWGLVSKFHQKYDSVEDKTVSLQVLSRELIGISLLLMKATFDEVLWNEDFMLDVPEIRAALCLYATGNYISKESLVPYDEMTDEEWWGEQFSDIEQIPTFLGQIHFLEAAAFKALDYKLSIDFEYVLSFLVKNRTVVENAVTKNGVLIEKKIDVSHALFDYYKDDSHKIKGKNNQEEYRKECFSGKSDIFDEFLYKLKLRLTAHQYIDQGKLHDLQELLDCEPKKITDITLWWRSLFLSSKCITPDIIKKNILDLRDYLRHGEHCDMFLTKVPKNNPSVKADCVGDDSALKELPIVEKSQSSLIRAGMFSTTKTPIETSPRHRESLSADNSCAAKSIG